jgi:lysophospholipase L1-like esterase
VAALLAIAAASSTASAQELQNNWVAAWQGSPAIGGSFNSSSCPSDVGLNNQTIRNIVFLTAGGSQVRVRISNAGGNVPLRVGAASVGLVDSGAATIASTLNALSFSGQPSTVVAAGAEALSDPVTLSVNALQRLAVSIYLPNSTGPATQHYFASGTNYLANGDQSASVDGSTYNQYAYCWMFVSGVDVLAPPQVQGTLVTLGASIVDGYNSSLDANNSYPNQLARQLAGRQGPTLSVANAGLAGNSLLANRNNGIIYGMAAPARFARDVLTQSSVRAIILMEGTNDIGANSSQASDLIQVDQQIIAQAHAAGLLIYGGTLPPFIGANAMFGGDYGTPSGEQQRQNLNNWIRTSGAFDGVVDFDAALQDPNNPGQLLPAYDSGDHMHPNDAGYLVMANAVKLDQIIADVLSPSATSRNRKPSAQLAQKIQ